MTNEWGEIEMKANDVKIDGEYQARIGKTLIPVRIVAEKASGGWTAVNITTGKKVFISLARLLQEMPAPAETTVTTEANLTTVEVPPATVEAIEGTSTKAKRGRKPKAETSSTVGKTTLSQLDAAAKVLGEAAEPMTTKEMVETMATKGYWSSPGGKTPHATLYSAILRELQSKGEASRFIKTERGHFKLRTA
jgi:short subunit dehydrogenase-like uncharacterized protein